MIKKIFVMLCLMVSLATVNVNSQSSTSTEYSYDVLSSILYYSIEYDLPVELVYQVIKVESDFNQSAVGKHGKYADEGLMQLNNQYSYKFASEIGIVDFNPFNADHNIWVGCYHLSNIKITQSNLGYSDVELWKRVLTVYNAGGSYLKKYGIRYEYVNKFNLEVLYDED